MPTVDYKPLASDVAANVITQAVYLALLGVGGALEHGFQDGVARAEYMNKVLRQTTVMSAAIAGMISDALASDVLDDGDVNALKAKFQSALLASSWSTGDVKLTLKVAADPGWVMMNDGTIGSATSGASTRANADCQALFTLLWTNVSDAGAPVVGGRGGSAALDWAANKKITLTKVLGRAIGISGAGAGLTARVLGQTLGEEKHAMTSDENGTHDHPYTRTNWVPGGNLGIENVQTTIFTDTPQTGTSGLGTPHENMQPTVFLNIEIKL